MEARQNNQSTAGIPMSIMVQRGRAVIDSIIDGHSIFDETQQCGLEDLETTSTPCMVKCMGKYRTLHTGSRTPLTEACLFLTFSFCADGVYANNKLEKYERARLVPPPSSPARMKSTYEIWCKCHLFHLCSGEAIRALSPNQQYCYEEVGDVVPAPQPKAKPKAKAAAAAAKAAALKAKDALQIANAQKQAARSVDFITSMVRGPNLLANAGAWKQVQDSVAPWVKSKMVVVKEVQNEEELIAIARCKETNMRLLRNKY